MTALLWYRRDLRLHDHTALRAALAHDRVIPVFCLDDRLLAGRHRSGTRTGFLLECLEDLERSLRERGSGLVVRRGRPEHELVALARRTGATEVHLTADPAAPRTGAGRPYTAFSPYHRAWLEAPRRAVEGPPSALPPLPAGVGSGRVPSLSALGLEAEVRDPPSGGERAGRERLARFLEDDVSRYGEDHDALGRDHTSRLSPYLHFGCVSAREVEQRSPDDTGGQAFRRQLCWRDFYLHVLEHFPRNARSELQARYRGGVRWSHARKPFTAWCDGRTGYPLVDAGMRQLRREGWMHNRARLVVGSFLTKDLGIDWRWGERHFLRLLLDGDEANNNGNWQWIASVGVDPQPAFRRILSPTRQMERFDPDGSYVRHYVPELRPVPDRYLREPWGMPPEVQREVGCVIGTDYPSPIVDHAVARRAALERYREAGRHA